MTLDCNAKVWLGLVFLTFASFALGVRGRADHGMAWILFLALLKALILGFLFMELHKAHLAWRLVFVGKVALVILALVVAAVWDEWSR